MAIPNFDNGARDLVTVSDVANSANDTTVTRLGDTIPTLRGALNSVMSSGGVTVKTLPELLAITPPVGAKPAGRVTEGEGKGYYIWNDTTWEKTDDPLDAGVPELEANLSDLDFRTGNLERYSVAGYAKVDVNTDSAGVAKIIHGITSKGVTQMAEAEVFGDLKAPGIPALYPPIAGKSWIEVSKPDENGNARVLSYISDNGAQYKYLFGKGLIKISDPQEISNLDSRVTALESGAGIGSGTSLNRFADACVNPLMDVNLTIIADSIGWGRTLPGQVYEPASHTLATKRDVITTPSWVNLLREWLGHTYLNENNETKATVEDAPGATSGDGGSGYFSEQQLIDPLRSTYFKLLDSDSAEIPRSGTTESGAMTPAPLAIPPGCTLAFEMFGAGFELIYGTSPNGGNFTVSVDGSVTNTQSFAGVASWGNALNVTTANQKHSIVVTNGGSIDFRLEAVRRTKIIRIVNQGIIGTATTTWLPTSSVLPNCLRADSNFCIVALGTNDRSLSTLPQNKSGFENRLRQIVDYLMTTRDQDIILLSNGATTDDYPWNSGSITRYFSMGDVARGNRKISQELNLSHIDIYALTRELQVNGDTSYLADGLHPNETGHKDYWFAEIKRRIINAWESK